MAAAGGSPASAAAAAPPAAGPCSVYCHWSSAARTAASTLSRPWPLLQGPSRRPPSWRSCRDSWSSHWLHSSASPAVLSSDSRPCTASTWACTEEHGCTLSHEMLTAKQETEAHLRHGQGARNSERSSRLRGVPEAKALH